MNRYTMRPTHVVPSPARRYVRAASAMLAACLWLGAADRTHAFTVWMGAGAQVGTSNLLLDVARGSFAAVSGGRHFIDAALPPSTQSPVKCGAGDDCIFLTSRVSTAELGGLPGADRLCNTLASAAGMPGQYVAWLSDSRTDAVARITSNGPYVTRSGTVVASGLADLVDGGLRNPIQEDEHGNDVPLREVWTGTDPLGLRTASNCADWTSGAGDAPYGSIGWSTAPDTKWTSVSVQFCDQSMSLYCLEQ